jgi:branched-chain amino acid transport system substrate-binding protein
MRKLGGVLLAAGALTLGTLVVPSIASVSAGAAAAPIVIGEICSCTGPLASSVVDVVPTLKAWVKATNASGGIEGHPVQVIYKDDDTNPGIAITEVQQMISADHVVGIINNSDVDGEWAKTADQANVPVIGGGLGSEVYFTDPNFFPEGQTLDALVTSFAAGAQKAHAKKAAFFYCAESPGCAQSIAPLRSQLPTFGSSLAYVTSVSFSAPNYTAQCLEAKQSGSTALIIADAALVVQNAVGDCAKQGYLPTDVIDGSAVNPGMAATPGLNNNLLVIQSDIPFSVTSNPQMQAMRTALKKYAPGVLTSSSFGETVVFQWVTGLLIRDAVRAAHGAATPAQLKQGLYALHADTLEGTAPALTFKKGKPTSVDCWFWARMQHGKFTTPYGLKPTCHSVSS